MSNKVLLIDGLNFIHRANVTFGPKNQTHALMGDKCACGAIWEPQRQTCYGELYTIVFNFFRNLRPIIEQFQPEKVFFCLEGGSPKREALYPAYKGNRIIKTAEKKSPREKVLEQADIIIPILKYFPITTVRARDYECDDVIGTLVEMMPEEDIIIISNDKDFIQLLQKDHLKHVKVYNPFTKAFVENPNYFWLPFICLTGDTADNIEGFPGIGPKKAEKLVNDPQLFADFLSLEENRARFSINKQLVELMMVPEEELILSGHDTDWDAILKAFQQMRFDSITNEKSWTKYKKTFECITL